LLDAVSQLKARVAILEDETARLERDKAGRAGRKSNAAKPRESNDA
jgi:hypothetical protein